MDRRTEERLLLVAMRVRIEEVAFERSEVRWISLAPGISGKLVRIDVYLVDSATASSLFHGAPSEEFCPFVVSGRRIGYERPKHVVIVRGDERYAEDICHRRIPVKLTRHGTNHGTDQCKFAIGWRVNTSHATLRSRRLSARTRGPSCVARAPTARTAASWQGIQLAARYPATCKVLSLAVVVPPNTFEETRCGRLKLHPLRSRRG